jgi:hypothetical protein
VVRKPSLCEKLQRLSAGLFLIDQSICLVIIRYEYHRAKRGAVLLHNLLYLPLLGYLNDRRSD